MCQAPQFVIAGAAGNSNNICDDIIPLEIQGFRGMTAGRKTAQETVNIKKRGAASLLHL